MFFVLGLFFETGSYVVQSDLKPDTLANMTLNLQSSCFHTQVLGSWVCSNVHVSFGVKTKSYPYSPG